ncbi:MAG: germination protein YpeB, partial [Clostridia bacterium]|nr:germination protein YpeB [Clostridia bacterium]
MFRIKRRRTLIRILSFTIAALVVSVSAAIYSSWLAYSYRRSIEYSYQRALSELAVHVNSIDLALQKGVYAGTPSQLAGLSAQIWNEAGAAKADLAEIPLYDNNMDNTYKFISQVGDYANSLTKSLTGTPTISANDRKEMTTLSGFAKKLSQQLSDLMDEMYEGRLSIFTANDTLKSSAGKEPSGVPNIDTGLKDIENNFSTMPTLIYDGPFSDNILKKKPLMTQGKEQVDKAKALSLAAAFMGLGSGSLRSSGETAGTLPTYDFATKTANISVTKAGGYVVRILDGREIGDAKLSNDQARAKARDYLSSHGIGSMKESYYQTNNDVCVINYAYMQGDIICYPDLIKVGVALDNGAIISFDATGYLVNHQARKMPGIKFGVADAKKLVSPLLKVKSVSLALIPMEDANESL